MSLSFKDQKVALGFGIAGRRKCSLVPHCSALSKDYHSNFLSHHKNDPSCVSFPQNLALTGDKYEWLVSIGLLGVNMFFFLGNMYKGISLQENSVHSTLSLFSFHSTTQRDEKSKRGEREWRPHKSWCWMARSDLPWSCLCTPSASSEDLHLLSLPSHLCDSMTLSMVVCQTQPITVGWIL